MSSLSLNTLVLWHLCVFVYLCSRQHRSKKHTFNVFCLYRSLPENVHACNYAKAWEAAVSLCLILSSADRGQRKQRTCNNFPLGITKFFWMLNLFILTLSYQHAQPQHLIWVKHPLHSACLQTCSGDNTQWVGRNRKRVEKCASDINHASPAWRVCPQFKPGKLKEQRT